MDYAIAVEQIYDGARFGRAGTYEQLRASWKDARPIPTELQLAEAYDLVLQARLEESLQHGMHLDRVALLRSDVELPKLTTEQRVDLMTQIMRKILPV